MISRGERLCGIEPGSKSKQGGTRQKMINKDDTGNAHRPTTIIHDIALQINMAKMPAVDEFRR